MSDTDGNDGDLRTAVDRFLDDAETVYGEYERGYVDADAALSMLERHVETLRTAAERDERDDGEAT